MNQEQIERTLKLHKLAYGVLMWLKEQARNNRSLLDSKTLEAMSAAKSCEEWVVRHLLMIPVNLRPDASDVPAFSHLFSSFFTTSFRVGRFAGGKRLKALWSLVQNNSTMVGTRNTPSDARKKQRRS